MHLDRYLESIVDTNFAQNLRETGNRFAAQNIAPFSHMERINGLLFGEVQSGKTAHTLACLASTADQDESFQTFIYLVTNSVALQEQTFERALKSLGRTFNVCSENDYQIRFKAYSGGQPRLVILKKEPRILATWLKALQSDPVVKQSPIFVVDDEADAATPNTKVNQEDESKIFTLVRSLRDLGTSSIFLQVTATPQSLLLQTDDSGLHPGFKSFFEPGPDYIGGDFFFGSDNARTSVVIPEDDLENLIDYNSKEPSLGLIYAISHFIVSLALSLREGETNLNCNIHPTVRIELHERIRVRVNDLLSRFENLPKNPTLEAHLESMRQNLNSGLSEEDWVSPGDVTHALSNLDRLSVVVLNSNSGEDLPDNFDQGFNIIIGGNSLSRGVTFPNLQTVYYTRDAKVKNADTFWQHSRVFGYQRRKETVRIFMPITLISLFRVLQEANSRLIAAVKSGEDRLSIVLPKGIARPTRPNVIDKSAYSYVLGGTNYFPPSPNQENYDKVFDILEELSLLGCELEEIDVDTAKALLSQASEDSSWPKQTFISALVAVSERVSGKVHLIVRRERNIGRTGTMLSPDDRAIGAQNKEKFLITIYEVLGDSSKKWDGKPFWMINVKLPDNLVYHHVS